MLGAAYFIYIANSTIQKDLLGRCMEEQEYISEMICQERHWGILIFKIFLYQKYLIWALFKSYDVDCG